MTDPKVAVVTGSGRGIGRAIAARLIADGMRVVLNSRTESAERAAAQLGDSTVAAVADVSVPGGARSVVEAAITAFGRVDVLVNNAGAAQVTPAVDLTPELWQRSLAGNLSASFFCCQAAAPHMLGAGSGVIVNIASTTGLVGIPGRAAYAAAKAGLIALTRVLALEWAPAVRVVGIAPSYIDTDMLRVLQQAGKLDRSGLLEQTPLGRLGSLDDVANLTAFLVSDQAAFLTGVTIPLDGGWTAGRRQPAVTAKRAGATR